jgi:hypothetical protein
VRRTQFIPSLGVRAARSFANFCDDLGHYGKISDSLYIRHCKHSPVEWLLMSHLLSLVPYVLAVGVFLQAFVTVRKERNEYESSKLRRLALVLLCTVAVLTVVSLYRDNNQRAEDKRQAAEQNKSLQGQVEAANRAQTDNTTLFLKSFDKLNQEVGDLKTEVKTDALQEKLTSVQADLEATQKALVPGPKAVLAFSFWPFYNPSPPQSATLANQARFPTNDDGSYRVEFSVVNVTDVDALDGDITLVICDLCKFANEPPGFLKLNGSRDNERYQVFQRILARTHTPDMTADIIAPNNQNFTVGILYRCHTCIVSSEESLGTVLISGSIAKRAPKARSPISRQPTKPAF